MAEFIDSNGISNYWDEIPCTEITGRFYTCPGMIDRRIRVQKYEYGGTDIYYCGVCKNGLRLPMIVPNFDLLGSLVGITVVNNPVGSLTHDKYLYERFVNAENYV